MLLLNQPMKIVIRYFIKSATNSFQLFVASIILRVCGYVSPFTKTHRGEWGGGGKVCLNVNKILLKVLFNSLCGQEAENGRMAITV